MQSDRFSPNQFPYVLPEEYGIVRSACLECPGVYYISVRPEDAWVGMTREFYAVERDTETISAEAKAYGLHCDSLPVILFSLDDPDSGHYIIAYEISRYRVMHHEPMEPDQTPAAIASYAMEYQSEYFGEIPAPVHTPWGRMTRYHKLMPGVFVFETEQIRGGTAIWYTLWEGDLSDGTQKKAEFLSLRDGEDRSFAFYTIKDSCLPVFELWNTYEQIHRHVGYRNLMNAIWNYHPEYAAAWNAREQSDAAVWCDTDSSRYESDAAVHAERLICLTEQLDDHFLKF